MGIATYFFFKKISRLNRMLLALLVFIVPSLLITILFIYIGDKPAPGSREVTTEELQKYKSNLINPGKDTEQENR